MDAISLKREPAKGEPLDIIALSEQVWISLNIPPNQRIKADAASWEWFSAQAVSITISGNMFLGLFAWLRCLCASR